MILISIFILLLTACTNMLIPDIQNYRSIHLNGNGWIQIPNQNYNCTNDLRVFDDNFTFEIYFSGDNKNTNSAGTIFSLTGKQTENFIDKKWWFIFNLFFSETFSLNSSSLNLSSVTE